MRLTEVEFSGGVRYRILQDNLGHGSEDVTSEIVLADGKSNPFGWSQYRMIHQQTIAPGCTEDVEIGWLYCGEPEIKREGYRYEIVKP